MGSMEYLLEFLFKPLIILRLLTLSLLQKLWRYIMIKIQDIGIVSYVFWLFVIKWTMLGMSIWIGESVPEPDGTGRAGIGSVLKGVLWREAWLRHYEKLYNVAVRRNAWQGVIWCAMACYGVLWRGRLIHCNILFRIFHFRK
uniref:Uncharacterized protein n=1 Tax=Lactuca sativa TaxID=4236 RepID=A0A9R1W974_LACSA|nr:hypothetical protein LSAT_V11C300147090 [Lactuca sativa]